MDDHGAGATPLGQETAPAPGERIFVLAEHEPLPEGVAEGDEGVVVIRLVAATPEEAAQNVAY